MKNEIHKDLKRELSLCKMTMASKDKKILSQEKQIERMRITVSVACDTTEDEKTKNVLRKLLK